MADNATSAVSSQPDPHSGDALDKKNTGATDEGESDKHGHGNSGSGTGNSDSRAISDQLEKALGDAQSLEDTIPLDVTRIIKIPKAHSDRAADKAAKPEKGGAGEKSSESASDATGSPETVTIGSDSGEPSVVNQSDVPTGNPVGIIHTLQSAPGRAARAESRAASTDAAPASAVDVGSSDSSGQGPALADTTTAVTPAPEAAGEPAKAPASHATPFAIDLLMSTTASRATLALLTTGLAGMEHVQGVPIAVVPAPTEAVEPGAEINPLPRDNNPVAGMGEEIAPDDISEVDPGMPVQSLAATALGGVSLDEVVGRVERALDGMVEASSLRRLLPWLAGAGLALAAVDVMRRQRSSQEQGRRESVGAEHDADTWLPRSITEKA